MNKKEKFEQERKWVYLCALSVVVCIWLLLICFNVYKPKVDYESMNNDILSYVKGLDNVKGITNSGIGTYKITLENETWYAADDNDKASYCLAVNTTITAICQEYKAIAKVQGAQIYYYDESGLLIAEPSDKSYTLESNILY